MSVIHDLAKDLMAQIEAKSPTPMDALKAKGEISITCGFMLGMITAADPDDPAKIDALRRAATERGYRV